MSRILAVDYGEARTGLAVSDFTGTIASPLTVIHERNFAVLTEKIVQVAIENKVSEIVVGNPVNMNGTKGEKSVKCEQLAENLRELLTSDDKAGFSVVMWDERLTTVAAHGIMNQNNRRGRKRHESIDSVAAALILEGYLGFVKNRE